MLDFIYKSNYESGLDVDLIAPALMLIMDVLIHFIQHHLIEFQPRDNYCELLQLLFLRAEGADFWTPRACHWAYWMAKLI